MASVLEKEMNDYFIQLNDDEQKSVVEMLRTFVKSKQKQVERISIDEYNKEIDEAMADLKRGDVYTHEEVVKMAKGW